MLAMRNVTNVETKSRNSRFTCSEKGNRRVAEPIEDTPRKKEGLYGECFPSVPVSTCDHESLIFFKNIRVLLPAA